jgi:hypothetical protein
VVAIRAAAICAPDPISETEKQKAKIRFEKLFLLSLFLTAKLFALILCLIYRVLAADQWRALVGQPAEARP